MSHATFRALPVALLLTACHGSPEPVVGSRAPSDGGLDASVPVLPTPAPTPPAVRDGDASDDDPDRRPRSDAGRDADAGASDGGGSLDSDSGADGGAQPPADAGGPGDGGCVAAPATTLDVLFMVDDSGSMAEEQAKLAQKLTRLVQVLTTGDKEAGKDAPRSDEYPGRRFPRPESVRFAVVTSNLGTPPGVQAPGGSQFCAGAGGDGLLVGTGAAAAIDQVDPITRAVVVPARPECAAVSLTPAYVGFGAGERHAEPGDGAALAQGLGEFRCIASTGIGGCGIEQSLEAAYKALAPSSVSDFVGTSTRGQGERNAFLRPDSLLAVVMVSDEDDCSLPAGGTMMFELNEVAGYAIGVRCQMLAERPEYASAIQPVQRYVDGLLGLRAGRPERLVFGGVVGLPQAGVDYADFDALLARDDMRPGLSAADPSVLNTVCGSPTTPDGGVSGGFAYPGRRFVHVAKGLAAGGAAVVLRSICDDDYAPVVDVLVDKIAAGLTGC